MCVCIVVVGLYKLLIVKFNLLVYVYVYVYVNVDVYVHHSENVV